MWNSITITRAERICHTDEMRSFFEEAGRIGMRQHGGLARMEGLVYNGQDKLVYFTGGDLSLEEMGGRISFSDFLGLLVKLIGAVLEVQEDSRLSIQNLDLEASRIPVDPRTEEIHMIYLPLQAAGVDASRQPAAQSGAAAPCSGQEDAMHWEMELRSGLIRIIRQQPHFNREAADAACQELADRMLDLRSLQGRLESLRERSKPQEWNQPREELRPQERPQSREEQRSQEWNSPREAEKRPFSYPKLTSLLPQFPLHFEIRKPEVILGKSGQRADVVVSDPTVSRAHCKIIFRDGHTYVEDLNSTNGTFVNNVRLAPGQRMELTSGDTLRLSGIPFAIQC